MAFADTLKRLMDERDMKAVDLARATGLSEAAVSGYLKGAKEPRGKQSVEIAKALKVPLDVLWDTDFAPRTQASLNITNEEQKTSETVVSEEDKKIIELFRLIPKDKREYFLGMFEGILRSQGLL